MMEDLKPPTGTGQWWPYLLDAKSDANLSLLGIDVTYIWFQLITDNPPNLLSLMPIFSVTANYWRSPALTYFFKLSLQFVCSGADQFVLHWSELPHFLPLLCYDYDSCKVTAVLSGFCSRSKEKIQRWYCCSVFQSVKSYGCIPCNGNGTVRELLASEMHCCLLSDAIPPFHY